MIELKSDRLVVSFPEVTRDAVLTIDFQRTLRIPDDGKDYPLPPGFGSFPLRHIDDHAERVPAPWLKRGGVLLPMYQSEALWLNFHSQYIPDRKTSYPFAVKVATGKINAVTGESWRNGLSRNPQDYLVVPQQPWLDGYCVEKGIIRQFVAMPLGQGYTVEEQVTGGAEVGGVQIEVFPIKKAVFERRFPNLTQRLFHSRVTVHSSMKPGLAPGGRMRQEIYEDPFSIHDWDSDHRSRCFVHLITSTEWQQITREHPPSRPLNAQQYAANGLPWFDYYDADGKALEGASGFAGIRSIAQLSREKRTATPDNMSISINNVVNLRAGQQKNQVREANF